MLTNGLGSGGRLVFCWSLLFVLAMGAGPTEAGYVTKNLTNNYYNDWDSQISNRGWVVWSGSDGHDYEIYLYKGSGSPIQLTNNSFDDKDPRINDKGWVVWSGSDGHDYEIYLYKGSGSPVKITDDNNYYDDYPTITDNGWVFWARTDGYGSEILLYKGSGSPIKLYDLWRVYQPLKINDNGWVVCSLWFAHDYEIYLYKGSGDPIQLTNNSFYDKAGAFHINDKGWVVWAGWDGHDYEIYLYKGSGSPVKITDNNYNDYYPTITDNGWVGWAGSDGHDYEIYLYKGSGSPVKITDNNYNDYDPRINDKGWVVWEGWDGHDWEIYCAAPADTYIYTYRYGNGDNYTGKVYADPADTRYYRGKKWTRLNETGKTGVYEITGENYTGVSAVDYGDVYVDSYYDYETGRMYADGKNGAGLLADHDKKFGIDYLGSECGYIIWGDKKKDYAKDDRDAVKFKFGYDPGTKMFYEADAPGKKVAILFSGGIDFKNNETEFYTQTLKMWQTCTATLGYDPGDVFVLAADGKFPGFDQNKNEYIIDSNWSAITKVKGTIVAATPDNLKTLLLSLQRELNHNHTFYFWCDDHGYNYSPKVNGKYTKPQAGINAWNGVIRDVDFAAWVNPLQVKYEVYAFGQCYAGGMIDNLGLKAGDGRFAAWATSWDSQSYFNGIHSWIIEWTAALKDKNIRYSRELGRYALEKDKYGPFGDEYCENPGWQGDNLNIWDSTAPTPVEEYSYTFTFSNKDYYQGKYYASVAGYYSSSGYATRVAPTFTSTDEFGKKGVYKVKPTASFWRDQTLNGKVYVTRYYDADCAKPHWCTVFGSWSSRGKNFLKSEQGYIIKLDVPKYYFGFGKYEADDD